MANIVIDYVANVLRGIDIVGSLLKNLFCSSLIEGSFF